MNRDGVYYYIRRVPCDLSDFYAIKRLCFSLKTKSLNTARRLLSKARRLLAGIKASESGYSSNKGIIQAKRYTRSG